MNSIAIVVKSAYGRNRMYPERKNGLLFTQLMGKSTFSPYDLYKIMELGFEITIDGMATFNYDLLNEFKEYCINHSLYN